jgi:hypothetical protein
MPVLVQARPLLPAVDREFDSVAELIERLPQHLG